MSEPVLSPAEVDAALEEQGLHWSREGDVLTSGGPARFRRRSRVRQRRRPGRRGGQPPSRHRHPLEPGPPRPDHPLGRRPDGPRSGPGRAIDRMRPDVREEDEPASLLGARRGLDQRVRRASTTPAGVPIPPRRTPRCRSAPRDSRGASPSAPARPRRSVDLGDGPERLGVPAAELLPKALHGHRTERVVGHHGRLVDAEQGEHDGGEHAGPVLSGGAVEDGRERAWSGEDLEGRPDLMPGIAGISRYCAPRKPGWRSKSSASGSRSMKGK